MTLTARIAQVLVFCTSAIAASVAGVCSADERMTDATPTEKVSKIRGTLIGEADSKPAKDQPLLLFHVLLPEDRDANANKVLGQGVLILECEKCPKVKTDIEGRFYFDGVPKGRYTIGLGATYDETTIHQGNYIKVNGLLLIVNIDEGVDSNVGLIKLRSEK